MIISLNFVCDIREERRMRKLQKRVLGRLSGGKREELTMQCGKLHKKEPRKSFFSTDITMRR
jgi:hypothetical protein